MAGKCLAIIARHVITCHLSQGARVSDCLSMTWQAIYVGPYLVRHVAAGVARRRLIATLFYVVAAAAAAAAAAATAAAAAAAAAALGFEAGQAGLAVRQAVDGPGSLRRDAREAAPGNRAWQIFLATSWDVVSLNE